MDKAARGEGGSYSRDERREDGDLKACRISQGRDMKELGARGRQQGGKDVTLQALMGVSFFLFLTFPSSTNGLFKVKCGAQFRFNLR